MNAKTQRATIQSPNCSSDNLSAICSIDLEMDDRPTSPLLHQQSRFLYILEGSGIIQIQGKDYELKQGTLVSMLPWQYSIITRVDKPLRYYRIIYNFDVSNRIIKGLLHTSSTPISIINGITYNCAVCLNPESRSRVEAICDQLKQEIGVASWPTGSVAEDEVTDVYINSLVTELLVLYYRCIDSDKSYPYDYSLETSDAFPSASKKELEIFQYIYQNLNAKLTLQDLAGHFYMSQSSISKYIKDISGMSYSDLVISMRFTKSMNLLLHTTLKLEELTDMVGFFDAAHFSHIFNKKAGMTANEFRSRYSQISSLCKTNDD